MHRSHHSCKLVLWGSGGTGRKMFVQFLVDISRIILNRRGRLAVTVYIII